MVTFLLKNGRDLADAEATVAEIIDTLDRLLQLLATLRLNRVAVLAAKNMIVETGWLTK